MLLTACAGTVVTHNVYEITPSTKKDVHFIETRNQENWIEDKDIISVMKKPTRSHLLETLGTPVVIEYHEGRFFYIYNYRTALYKDKVKPAAETRMREWVPIEKTFAFEISGNQVISGSGSEALSSFKMFQNFSPSEFDTTFVKTYNAFITNRETPVHRR